ncbi:hypothetical protein [Sphingosinicella sp. CPCC 101087]|uniref:hypothetical protein n=1 Tax=Sphingosinicella sp. CPCC 101087 TaxID=2497754 RepID=UPI00101D3DFB|nr:hypothetical protein [Sphingosinicella sp. CPCC 101087]
MTSPFTLAALCASLLVGVATGIHLGESAVAMIDPVHFQGPALHPRDRGAAIDEPARLVPRPAAPQPYGWDQGYAARAAVCGDCDVWDGPEAEVYSAAVPYFGEDEVSAEVPAGPREDEAESVRQISERPDLYAGREEPPERNIEPYAYFPLGYEEGVFGAPLAEERPAPEDPRSQDEFRSEDVYRY